MHRGEGTHLAGSVWDIIVTHPLVQAAFFELRPFNNRFCVTHKCACMGVILDMCAGLHMRREARAFLPFLLLTVCCILKLPVL